MNKILMYVPQTSMIMTEEKLQTFLLSRYKSMNTVKTSIDFSKRCQYQRFGLGPIRMEIDSILGVGSLYEMIHKISMNMMWLFLVMQRKKKIFSFYHF